MSEFESRLRRVEDKLGLKSNVDDIPIMLVVVNTRAEIAAADAKFQGHEFLIADELLSEGNSPNSLTFNELMRCEPLIAK